MHIVLHREERSSTFDGIPGLYRFKLPLVTCLTRVRSKAKPVILSARNGVTYEQPKPNETKLMASYTVCTVSLMS